MTNFFAKFGWTLAVVAGIVAAGSETAGVSAVAHPAACTDAEPSAPTISIVTTIRPLELIVRDLIGEPLQDRFTVTCLIPASVSPHGFEPKASQVAQLHRADIVIANGGGLDDWALRDLPNGTISLRFADIAEGHEHDQDSDTDHDHDHDHHEASSHDCGGHNHTGDEHYWLDPALVSEFARASHEALSRAARERLTDASGVLRQLELANEQFHETVDEVDARFAASFEPHQSRRIVMHHNVFSRVARRYKLGEPLVLRPLTSSEPTPRDLRRAIRTIRAEGIAAILTEPQFNPAAADRIREETDVRLIAVDPLGGEATSWTTMMGIGNAVSSCPSDCCAPGYCSLMPPLNLLHFFTVQVSWPQGQHAIPRRPDAARTGGTNPCPSLRSKRLRATSDLNSIRPR